jgi:hypothetical protein
MRFGKTTAVLFMVILFFTRTSLAGETDNYFAWGKEIKDSADLFNDYLNDQVERILVEINAGLPSDHTPKCVNVVMTIMEKMGTTRVVFRMAALNTALERWAESNPAVDRAPPFGTPEDEYVAESVFAPRMGPLEKKFVSIDPTINIGGIYFGTDKLSHFLGSGFLYYKTYLKTLRQTRSEIAALNAAIESGCQMEAGILGMKTTGVFSFADLEANYQGLMLALDLCRPDSPLKMISGKWVLAFPLDIRKYVNPDWDETENVSVYKSGRWQQVKRNIQKKGYCRFLSTPWLIDRKRNYAAYWEKYGGKENRYARYGSQYLHARRQTGPAAIDKKTAFQTTGQERFHIEAVCR